MQFDTMQKEAVCRMAYMLRSTGLLKVNEIERIAGYSINGGSIHQAINRGQMLLRYDEVDVDKYKQKMLERLGS